MPDSSNDRTSQLERAEHYIYLAAGYILAFAAAGVLVAAIIEMVGSIIDGKYITAMVHLLDRVLLAPMLAEIIFLLARCRRLLSDRSHKPG